MITDVYLQSARAPSVMVAPTGAMPLPGINTILARETPGGAPLATAAEAVTQLTKTDYTGGGPTGGAAIYADPVVQGYAYATNPRKDGTTPMIGTADVGTNSGSSATKSPALLAAIARNYALAHPTTSGNDTGMSGVSQPSVPAGDPSTGLSWAALLIVGAVVVLLFKRK